MGASLNRQRLTQLVLVGVAVVVDVSPDWECSTDRPSSLLRVAEAAPVPRDEPPGCNKVARDDRVSTDCDRLVLQFGFSIGGPTADPRGRSRIVGQSTRRVPDLGRVWGGLQEIPKKHRARTAITQSVQADR